MKTKKNKDQTSLDNLVNGHVWHVVCQVWVGTKDGTIYIYSAVSKQLWKTIKAHDDAVRSLCSAESRYIMSGGSFLLVSSQAACRQ